MRLRVNGNSVEWQVGPGESLLEALRRHGYHGAKRGCESGECGACAVQVDGLALDSCLLLAMQADGADVITIEGLEQSGRLHAVQEAFVRYGAIQCGYCIPGMVVTAANFLSRHPDADEAQLRHALAGNLCRCTGYKKQIEAVVAAQEEGNDGAA